MRNLHRVTRQETETSSSQTHSLFLIIFHSETKQTSHVFMTGAGIVRSVLPCSPHPRQHDLTKQTLQHLPATDSNKKCNYVTVNTAQRKLHSSSPPAVVPVAPGCIWSLQTPDEPLVLLTCHPLMKPVEPGQTHVALGFGRTICVFILQQVVMVVMM